MSSQGPRTRTAVNKQCEYLTFPYLRCFITVPCRHSGDMKNHIRRTRQRGNSVGGFMFTVKKTTTFRPEMRLERAKPKKQPINLVMFIPHLQFVSRRFPLFAGVTITGM